MVNRQTLCLVAAITVSIALCDPMATAQDCGCCTPHENYDSCAGYLGDECCCQDDIWTRSQLTGDWYGRRSCLAESGITLDADATMFYMGVIDGGLDRRGHFSGHNDYIINADFGKMGIRDGLSLKLRAEHRYGTSLAESTGALLGPNVAADLPVADSDEVYLTNVLFTQMLSERFGVFAGKLDTLDGDLNDFAHGRGKTQFSNLAFVGNPLMLRTIPYSTLGAGFIILGDDDTPLFAFSVLNPVDTATTSGFDELFANGVTLTAELRLPTTFFDLPGHQLFGGAWSSRTYATLDQDPRIVLPNVPIAQQTGSWAAYWNFDQYLCVDPCNPGRGWGVFGRSGIADDNTNPLQAFLSFGVGGHSMICGRDNDTFGAGWYYSYTSDEIGPVLAGALGGLGNGQGVELFYNYEVTPWFQLTPDLQVIVPARETVDTATVLGLRGRIVF